jgi:hypothetical protein
MRAVLWPDEQISVILAAFEAAHGGQPTVLSMLGRPGMGKTSLQREIASRASGFNVLEADGQESVYREPFGLLRQLGVRDVRPPGATLVDPLVAAQGLRDLVDTLSPTGPVLILVDDLQWADQESVESLYCLVRRAHGDRLLVVLASRLGGETVAAPEALRLGLIDVILPGEEFLNAVLDQGISREQDMFRAILTSPQTRPCTPSQVARRLNLPCRHQPRHRQPARPQVSGIRAMGAPVGRLAVGPPEFHLPPAAAAE